MDIVNIERFEIRNVPSRAYYIPQFVTKDEEELIIKNIYSVPKPKWTQLSNRRLQNWGGIPHNNGMITEQIPLWLQSYIDKINLLNVMNGKLANHVLVNEYLPGQGIMPHLDGSLFYPTITTISLGSHIVLKFFESSKTYENSCLNLVFSFLLEARSLLVLQKDLYSKYLHSIEEIVEDKVTDQLNNLKHCNKVYDTDVVLRRKTRISLTIRHVPKATKMKINVNAK